MLPGGGGSDNLVVYLTRVWAILVDEGFEEHLIF